MINVKKFLNEIKVYDCLETTKIRLGNKHDGGYIALKELCERTPAVYSFGIGDDISFELDFDRRFSQTKFYLFDPTITKLPSERPNFNFYQKSLNEGYDKFKYLPYNSMLKVDIEGDEWEAFSLNFLNAPTITDQVLSLFSQVIVEFHIIHVQPREGLSPYFQRFYQEKFDKINEYLFSKYAAVFKRLDDNFYIFHLHANNSLSLIEVDGYSMPPLLEISLVRKNLVKDIQETKSSFPIEGLDFPNKRGWMDIGLGALIN